MICIDALGQEIEVKAQRLEGLSCEVCGAEMHPNADGSIWICFEGDDTDWQGFFVPHSVVGLKTLEDE
jgi:hypothetical protein